jgi:hypothetical protein
MTIYTAELQQLVYTIVHLQTACFAIVFIAFIAYLYVSGLAYACWSPADVQVWVAHMQNQDVVQLQVGYHVLEGKRIPLKKPMAIMDKVQETDSEGNTQTVCKVGRPAWGVGKYC